MWVEINNPSSKNILCGCIYRHPNTDIDKFIKYLNTVDSAYSHSAYSHTPVIVTSSLFP